MQLTLSRESPVVETAEQTLGATTASIKVRLRRPTAGNPLDWDSGTTVRVSIIETVDGREYLHSGEFTGGVRLKGGSEVAEASMQRSPIVQARFDGGRDTFIQNGRRYLQMTRIGETAQVSYSARVKVALMRGDGATIDIVAIETTEAPAPIIEYHRSVAVDSVSDGQDTSGDGVITVAIDPVGTTNLAAFAGSGNSGGSGGQLGSTTYDGVAMVEKWDQQNGSFGAHAGYTLAGIPASNVNVVNTLGGSPDEHAFGVIVFTGVDQTTPIGTAAFGPGTTSPATNTVTDGLYAAGIVVDNLYAQGVTPTIGADQTQQATEDVSGNAWRMSTQLGSIDPAVMSWTFTDTDWGHGAIAFRPAISAAVTGTAIASITESDIVAGGKTIIITLTDETWIP